LRSFNRRVDFGGNRLADEAIFIDDVRNRRSGNARHAGYILHGSQALPLLTKNSSISLRHGTEGCAPLRVTAIAAAAWAKRIASSSASFQQRGHQRTIKGIASGDGINGLHFKARNRRPSPSRCPDATAAKRNDHGTNAFVMQHTRGFRRIVIVFNANAGQLFRFGFVRGNDIHQRQQFI
jgi:3-deoxy-D-arabino-heptulosonate 7-phosphate (DAHP) synthase class II